ncbi:phage tail assembly protein T [Burkholderia pseudomallei]|uniref:phage tail assembly protein T n=1 Tax=Burkholderia pseudomallei TaxID=28450 RepID=UPI0006806555|nr:hypothetical protein [Burkholderia pseudomallei]
MLANLDSAELTEWVAFDRMEPIGEFRADLRAGIVAATVANYGGRDIRVPRKPSDFMPLIEREEERPLLLTDPNAQAELILGAFGNCHIIRKAA